MTNRFWHFDFLSSLVCESFHKRSLDYDQSQPTQPTLQSNVQIYLAYSSFYSRALPNFLGCVFHLLWLSVFSAVVLTPAARSLSQSLWSGLEGGSWQSYNLTLSLDNYTWHFQVTGCQYDQRWSFLGAVPPCKTGCISLTACGTRWARQRKVFLLKQFMPSECYIDVMWWM